MSTIPTFVNEQSGETTCADHAGRYLTAALNKRPDLKTTNTPLGRWIRVNGDEYACETCSPISTRATTTPSKENTNMPTTIAVPVRKSKKTAPKTAAKKETAVPAKTKTQKTTVAKPVAKKAAPKKAEPKAAPKAKRTVEPKMFLVYRDIESDVTAQARKAKSFDPIRYEGVLSGKSITAARKALAELKGDEYGKYEVMPSYDPKRLTHAALAKFDGATEKVTSLAKDTYKVTLRNIEGLTQDEVQELALYAWIVDAGKKASKPSGNERMLDRRFDFEELKPLKNNRVNVTFTAK